MRELVITRKSRGFGLSLQRPQASVDNVPWADLFVEGLGLQFPLFQQTLVGNVESVSGDYLGFAQRLFKEAPSVFALIANRMMLFQEVRFKFRRIDPDTGRPGDLFGSAELAPLEQPWPGGTTRNLLALGELFNSIAGNAFFARRPGNRLQPLRPDWTALVYGSERDEAVEWFDPTADLLGYLYQPGGPAAGREPEALLPEQVIHYKPLPDPEFHWRGMSWLTPIVQEALADKEMTGHKRKFLQGGATPNLAVTLDPEKLGIKEPEDFDAWVEKFIGARERQGGNPYRTLFTLGGADPKVIGANLDNMDFSKVQAAGEVRMAAAAMVHPAIACFSEGLQGSALNAGNLKEAFRQFASGTMRPLWGDFAGAAGRVITPPSGGPAELWYDDRDVPALKEDIKDLAEVQQNQASTISTLITAGYEPDSAVDAIVSGDLRRLKHTGRVSVQLHDPTEQPTPPGTNGSGNREQVPAP